ncbi:MAG: nickel pincer cofactor biosynthesis protein LarB [Gemmatimonadota bacterium]|nr:MAG: nickel pincer cofactor biosynthesis protein LarB [Gemmatimonadota bacterium]
MSDRWLVELLAALERGDVSAAQALEQLGRFPVEDLSYANVDHLRPLIQGFHEVVFAEGKTVEQVVGICESLERQSGTFLVTRADAATQQAVLHSFLRAEVNVLARTIYLAPDPEPKPTGRGTILVVSAGTSDLPVAEEAAVVCRALRNRVETLYDVGVAGIHRLLRHSDVLQGAAVVIVAAGMDGALPSVVGGLVKVPVIAVPTSVGYGAAFGGVSALLAMLNSCASGVTVVNIDNGFGAAAAASRINQGT